MRRDGRQENELRPIDIIPNFTDTKGGSVLICWGNTRVLCTALMEEGTMPFLKGTGKGWLTAEYAMLPSSTGNRKKRDFLKQDGRSTEIQRLIGRSLRSGVDLNKLGERVIYVDCDVLQADGGTRTASITGAWVALADCINWMKARNMVKANVMRDNVAAISCGIYNGTPVLDLDYAEDSEAQTDANFVMTGDGRIIEVQGTAEREPFTEAELLALMALARKGIARLVDLQKLAVA